MENILFKIDTNAVDLTNITFFFFLTVKQNKKKKKKAEWKCKRKRITSQSL